MIGLRPVAPPIARTMNCRCGALVNIGTACTACGTFALSRREMPGEITEERVREIVREEIAAALKDVVVNMRGIDTDALRNLIADYMRGTPRSLRSY